MEVLIVEASPRRIGLRMKKFDGGYHTANHQSEQQDDLRNSGLFSADLFGLDNELEHLFVGYRSTGGVSPKLRDVAISFELGKSVHWCQILWSAERGFDAKQTVTDPLPMDMGDGFEVRPERRATGTDSAARSA